MTHEAQKGTNTRSLLQQPGLTIATGAMGLDGKQQSSKVTFGSLLASATASKSIVSTLWRQIFAEATDPLQRDVGSPGPQQSEVHQEVLQTQKRLEQQFQEQLLWWDRGEPILGK